MAEDLQFSETGQPGPQQTTLWAEDFFALSLIHPGTRLALLSHAGSEPKFKKVSNLSGANHKYSQLNQVCFYTKPKTNCYSKFITSQVFCTFSRAKVKLEVIFNSHCTESPTGLWPHSSFFCFCFTLIFSYCLHLFCQLPQYLFCKVDCAGNKYMIKSLIL